MNELGNNVKIEFDKESFVDRMAQRLKDDDKFRHDMAWLCASMIQNMLSITYSKFPNTASMSNACLITDLVNLCCCSNEKTCNDT